jgi:hypothetical protein
MSPLHERGEKTCVLSGIHAGRRILPIAGAARAGPGRYRIRVLAIKSGPRVPERSDIVPRANPGARGRTALPPP